MLRGTHIVSLYLNRTGNILQSGTLELLVTVYINKILYRDIFSGRVGKIHVFKFYISMNFLQYLPVTWAGVNFRILIFKIKSLIACLIKIKINYV
jgi:hypothetical protein